MIVGTPGALKVECAGEQLLADDDFKGVGEWRFPFKNEPLTITCGDASVVIDPYQQPASIRAEVSDLSSGRCLIIDVQVLDEHGLLVQDFESSLKIEKKNSGRPCMYTPSDLIHVSSGKGRLLFFRSEHGDECTMTISGEGFEPIEVHDRWTKSERTQISAQKPESIVW